MSLKKVPTKKTLFALTRELTLMDSAETVTFSVYLDPVAKEDKVKLYAPKFESGSVEDWLEWRKHFEMIVAQKELSGEPRKKMKLLRMLLAGSALEDFEAEYINLPGMTQAEKETEANYVELMKKLTAKYIPPKHAHRTRAFMREVKKPRSMTVEDFKTRLTTINGYLKYMPDYKGLNSPLDVGELQLLFEQAMPKVWQESIAKTGRHEEMTMMDSLQYMKMMEDLEEANITRSTKQTPISRD